MPFKIIGNGVGIGIVYEILLENLPLPLTFGLANIVTCLIWGDCVGHPLCCNMVGGSCCQEMYIACELNSSRLHDNSAESENHWYMVN